MDCEKEKWKPTDESSNSVTVMGNGSSTFYGMKLRAWCFVCAFVLAPSLCWASGTSVCGVSLDGDIRKVLTPSELGSPRPSRFAAMGRMGEDVFAETYEVDAFSGCDEIARSKPGEEVLLTMQIDVVNERIVSFRYRPTLQDCDAIAAVMTLIMGRGSERTKGANVHEWRWAELGRRVLVSHNEYGCWITQQKSPVS